MRIERDQLRTLGVVAGLFLAFGLCIWLPAHLQRQRFEAQIAESRKALGIHGDTEMNLSQWYSQVVSMREQIQGAQRYVPEEDELADVLRRLTKTLSRHSMSDPEVSTGTQQHYSEYSAVPVTLRFEGSFMGVYRVLSDIETMRRLIRIDRLELTSDRHSPDEPLQVLMELSTFFAQPPREPDA